MDKPTAEVDREAVLETFWEKVKEAQARDDVEAARAWLEGIVTLDETSIDGWLALAGLVADPREQMQCYSHVLGIAPGHAEAKAGLREARRRL